MTKDNLIAKQQIKIKKLKKIVKNNEKIKHELLGYFYSVGQPLNDNILEMNNQQLSWCTEVIELIFLLNRN